MTRAGLLVRARLRAGFLSVLLVILFGAMPGAAQSPQGGTVAIGGYVRDASGGVLVGAVVDAVVADRTIASVATGPAGRYEIHVPAGVPVALHFRRDGFAERIVPVADTRAAVQRDVELAIGRVSDTLVVTASRGAEGRDTLTQSVSVLTRSDVEALGSSSLADLLRAVPGVNLEGNGREGALMSLFARGGESDYNLVLIDGVRMNLNGGGFDFSSVAAAGIERVEVVRGAQSSLWGSDAIGSVVHVFTRRSRATDPPLVSGSLEGGSFETWRGEVRMSGGAGGRTDYQAALSHRRTNGAFADLLPQDDAFEQTTFNGGVGTLLGTRASVRTGVRYNSADGRLVGPIAYGAFNTGTSSRSTDVTWQASAAHTAGTRYAATASISYLHGSASSENRIVDAPVRVHALLEGTHGARFPDGPRLVRLIGAAEFEAWSAAGAAPAPGQFLASATLFDFPFTSATELRRPAFRYQGDYMWGGGQRLSGGYEWERESDALQRGVSLDNQALFVQQQVGLADRWFVTAGARIDSRQRYDTFISPKLSAGGFLLPAGTGAISSLKVFANIGRGIKSPTFDERLGGAFADPNPDLKVERARTADVGVEATMARERVRATATYFDNAYRDQVAYRFGPVGDGRPEYINIDGSEARGWELEVALQRPVAGLSAAGSYSLVDTEVVTSLNTSQQFLPGQPLLRRPRHSGMLRAAFSAGRITVNGHARLVGKRHDNSFLFLETVAGAGRPDSITTDITVNPGYVIAGLGLDVRAHAALTLFVRGDNIADAEYESALGYPGLPRSIVAGVRFMPGR